MNNRTTVAERLLQVQQAMQSGLSLDELLDDFADKLRPGHRTLMQRASLSVFFDKALFESVIDQAKIEPFDVFVKDPDIACVDPRKEIFRVKDSAIARNARDWLANGGRRTEIRDYLSAVHRYLMSAHLEWIDDLFRLRFQLVAEPARGLTELIRQFTEADTAFNLSACHALMLVLRDLDEITAGDVHAEVRLLNDEQREFWRERAPYIAVRGRYIDEYTRSTPYQQRRAIADRLEPLLASRTEWMFPVYGAGGHGKTMFVRWLIARRCLPYDNRIPVAKLDFDAINTAKLSAYPWLILPKLAEQLNWQMSGIYDGLVGRYAGFMPVLLPPSLVPPDVDIDGIMRELESDPTLDQDVIENFAAPLRLKPAIVVLDTIEAPVLHYSSTFAAILAMFRAIKGEHGSGLLKLVMCGRYNLKQEPHKFLEDGDPDPVRLGPFSAVESRLYLTHSRRIAPSLVEAISSKASGNPFLLSLLSDIVIKRSISRPEDIDVMEAKYDYLIERVIEWIPEEQWQVRWVVRYGVVPRRLTKHFLECVMKSHIRREVAWASRETYRDHLTDCSHVFRRSDTPELEIDTDMLWMQLRSYADSEGWLRADESEVCFQPEVIVPMRELLQKEELIRELHHEAASWFERQASKQKSDPIAWANNIADVFYHMKELRLPGTQAWFADVLSTPEGTNPQARVPLLEEVLTILLPPPESALGEETASPIMAPRFMWLAHYELARHGAGIGWGACRPARSLDNIRMHLHTMRILEDDANFEAPTGRETDAVRLIGLSVALDGLDHSRARQLTDDLADIACGLADADRYTMHVLRARMLSTDNVTRAASDYRSAIELALGTGHLDWRVLNEACGYLIGFGHTRVGLALLSDAIERADTVPIDALENAAELHLRARSFAQAEQLALRAYAETRTATPDKRYSTFGSERLLILCSVARGFEPRSPARVEGRPPRGQGPVRSAQYEEVVGLNAAYDYFIDTAYARLQRASSEYAGCGDRAGAAHSLLLAVWICKELRGDWIGALELADRFPETRSDALYIERQHLRSLVLRKSSESAQLVKTTELTWYQHVVALLTATDRRNDASHLVGWLEHVKEVDYPPLRYAALHWFRSLPRLDAVQGFEAELLQLVPLPQPGASDYFARVFNCIEMLRCLGSPRTASLIDEAFTEAFSKNAWVTERLIDAAHRLGHALDDKVDLILAQCRRFAGHPRDVATRVRLANVLLERGKTHLVERLGPLPEKLPECLQGSIYEALAGFNLWMAGRRDASSEARVRLATRTMLALGREADAGRMSRQIRLGQVDVLSTDSDHYVVPMELLSGSLGRIGDGRIGSISDAQHLVSERREETIHCMRDALPVPAMSAPLVELAAGSSVNQSIPWELAIPRSCVCFRSNRNLRARTPSGVGDIIADALPRAFRRVAHYFAPTVVAIFRPPSFYQKVRQRGFDAVSSRSLAEIMRSHGLKAFEPELNSLASVRDALIRQQPALIIVQAPIVERRGRLSIDLPMPTSSDRGDPPALDVELCGSLIRLAREDDEPVVFLAPPRPTHELEAARQLLLRNQFAADLARRTHVRAVMCAGLFEPSQVEQAAERLANLVASRPRLSELLMLYRNELEGDHFCTDAAMLFTSDPKAVLK